MAEHVEEIVNLIENLKRENEVSSEDFLKQLADIKSRLENIQDNKEDLNLIVNNIMRLVDSKVLLDESKLDDIENVLSELKSMISVYSENEDLSEQVKTLADNFKSGFNSVISFANKDADAKNLLLERIDALEKAVKSGTMLDTLRLRTDELVKGYENFISDSNLRHGNMVSALVDLKNKIDDYSSKNNYTFGSIDHNVEDTNSKISELESTISSNLGNVNSKLYSLGDDIQKILNDGFDHLKYLSSNISEALNSNSIDAKTSLECLRANIQDYSQNLNGDIENLSKEILGKIEELLSTNSVDKEEKAGLLKNLNGEIQNLGDRLLERFEMISAASEVHKEENLNLLKKLNGGIERLEEKLFEKLEDLSADKNNDSVSQSELLDNFKVEFKILNDELSEKLDALLVSKGNDSADQSDLLDSMKAELRILREEISEKVESFRNIKIVEDVDESDKSGVLPLLENKIQNLGNVISEKFNMLSTAKEIDNDEKFDVIKNLICEYKNSLEKLAEDVHLNSNNTVSELAELKLLANEILPKQSDLDNMSELITVKLSDFNKSVSDGVNGIKSYMDSVLEEVKNIPSAYDDFELQQKISELKDELGDSVLGYEQAISVLSNRLEEYIETAEQVSEDARNSQESARNEVSIIKDKFEEFSNKLSNLVTNSGLIEILADIRRQFATVISAGQNNKEIIIDDLKSTIESSLSDFSSRILGLAEDVAALETALNAKDYSEEVMQNLSEIRLDLGQSVASLEKSIKADMEAIKTSFEPLQESFKVLADTDITAGLNSVKEQIELSYVNILSEMDDRVENNPAVVRIENSYKDLISQINNLEGKVKDTVQSCIESMESEFAVVQKMIEDSITSNGSMEEIFRSEISKIEEKINECSGNTRESIIQQLESVKEAIEQKRNVDQSAIIDAIMPLLDNEELLNVIRGLNKNLADKIDELKQDEMLAFQDISDIANSISNTVEYTLDVINEKFENSGSNAASIIQNIEILGEKLEGLYSRLDNDELSAGVKGINREMTEIKSLLQAVSMSSKMAESYEQTLKVLDGKLDIIAMTDNTEEMNVNFQQIKSAIDSIHNTMSTDTSMQKLIKVLGDKLDEIAKSDNQDLLSCVNDIKADINYLKLGMEDSESKLDKYVKTLDSKIDVLVQSTSDDSAIMTDLINSGVDEIKECSYKLEDLVKELNSKVDILAMSDDSDIMEEIYEIRTLVETQINDSSYKESVESSLHKIIEEIDKMESDVSDIDFSKRTEEIKDAVIAAIVSVTSEISFVEETEELKDFVSEKTGDIHRTLMDVKHQLQTITNSSGDMDLYTYTLQDVESDLARLRMTVNEIANKAPQNELSVISSNMNKISKAIDDLRRSITEADSLHSAAGGMNDEIMSISSRLNKLLLSQEEIDGKILSKLENNISVINSLDTAASRKHFEDILETINKRLENSFDTINVLKNVMTYLGEWMDGTTDTLSSIYDKCSPSEIIDSVKDALPDNAGVIGILEDKLNQQETKIKELSDVIESRMNQQDSRIDRIESQLDRICEILDAQNSENTDNARLDRIEEKLKSLSTNIEKLAAYVE